ncbi:putative shwachman-bodian-diamond syndrome protein [Golovinomyces cichoracearum]|uniref:Putative shwachman-bodian-diamond syndrome protein n=1 Tax=Golovinomyces cichoracearum TaxID=62708 RepID=A0A420HIV0_9PEZI|nr:putative shwachman-bodian-diamond syndrome protein [Golovinomyces cichoracearum]
MARGDQTKVHFKGKDEDFIIFIDDVKTANDWKTDKSKPLAQVVSAFKVFVTHKYVSTPPSHFRAPLLWKILFHRKLTGYPRHGAQGNLDTASTATLENEFGTSVVEDVIKTIIEKGTIQETEVW